MGDIDQRAGLLAAKSRVADARAALDEISAAKRFLILTEEKAAARLRAAEDFLARFEAATTPTPPTEGE